MDTYAAPADVRTGPFSTGSALLVIFVAAIALVAAAAGDAFVEGLSNAAVFGRGAFTDRSSLDLVPLSILALGAFAGALCLASFARLRAAAAARGLLTPAAALRLLPAVLTVQLGIVYVAESLEQIAVAGHPLGGIVWLGGPLPVSIAIHAVFALCFAAGFARLLAVLSAAVAAVVQRAIMLAREHARHGVIAAAAARRELVVRRVLIAGHLGKRGPPAVVAAV